MSYLATIYDSSTGCFLMRCSVEAHDLHEAERAAITKGTQAIKGTPHELDVRHLHQLPNHKQPELAA